MDIDKRNIGRDPDIQEGVYCIPQELEARVDGDRIIVRQKETEDERIRKALRHLVTSSKELHSLLLFTESQLFNIIYKVKELLDIEV